MESLAKRAKRSAQETVSGHSFSKADLISSMTSNPRAESRFASDRFSLSMVPLLSKSTEASHPYTNQSLYIKTEHFSLFMSNIIYLKNRLARFCQTLTKQSWKWSLRIEAAMRGSLEYALATKD